MVIGMLVWYRNLSVSVGICLYGLLIYYKRTLEEKQPAILLSFFHIIPVM